jgi:membrane associated rhomboid family serine protease
MAASTVSPAWDSQGGTLLPIGDDKYAGGPPALVTAQTAQGGGVAYLAHVGGFVVGLVLVRFFASGARSQTAWA